MTDHVFSDINRDELFAVMNGKSVTNEFWYDHRSTTPSLDHSLPTRLVHFLNPAQELEVDKGPFF